MRHHINKGKKADKQSGEAVEVASASAVLTSQLLFSFLLNVGVEDIKITIVLMMSETYSLDNYKYFFGNNLSWKAE